MSLRRLYRWYETAAPDELYAGRTWYPDARQEVCRIVDKYRWIAGYISHETVAGVIAVLSPNCTWETNLHDAENVIASYPMPVTVSTYNNNREKAYAILSGADTNDSSGRGRVPSGIVRGPKVTAFYENLRGDDSALTLDSHAFNAWKGYRATGSKLPNIPAAERRQAVADYIQAAKRKGETNAAFQAVIWLVWKRRVDSGMVSGYGETE